MTGVKYVYAVSLKMTGAGGTIKDQTIISAVETKSGAPCHKVVPYLRHSYLYLNILLILFINFIFQLLILYKKS